jgi:hypothetical protein
MELLFHSAEKISRGCSLFAWSVGTAIGYGFGFYFEQRSYLEPELTHQFLTQTLFGHLPTFLVSAFILLRVAFQLSTDQQSRTKWNSTHQMLSYAGGCAFVCLMVWAWFFLASMLGFLMGITHASRGFAKPIWESFWLDFDFQNIFHALFRMVLLAIALSVMTFIETSFLRAARHELAALMSRFMMLGMLIIVCVELIDLSLM